MGNSVWCYDLDPLSTFAYLGYSQASILKLLSLAMLDSFLPYLSS